MDTLFTMKNMKYNNSTKLQTLNKNEINIGDKIYWAGYLNDNFAIREVIVKNIFESFFDPTGTKGYSFDYDNIKYLKAYDFEVSKSFDEIKVKAAFIISKMINNELKNIESHTKRYMELIGILEKYLNNVV